MVILVKFGMIAMGPRPEIRPEKPIVERGSIVDRNGKPLAVQTSFYHMGLSPIKQKYDIGQFATDVCGALDMDRDEVIRIASIALNPEKGRFVYLKKKMNLSMYEEVRKITEAKRYNFVSYNKIPGRVYPENTLVSQLIGYMGDEGQGLAGIEFSMQNELSPNPTEGEAKQIYGNNIYLSIDAKLQYKLEKIAREALETTQAANFMLIAASAKTGEILSYLSLPEANLNAYGDATIEETIDRPAMTFFEPGSVFKVFSIAAAYDAGLIRQDDIFLCDGIFEKRLSNGDSVHINCLSHHGYLTARGALEQSCNDVTAQITDRMNTDAFLAKIRALGFGQKTGTWKLPGETPGSLADTNSRHWSARSKMTISIGQEIGVTALQIVQAATALANKGTLMRLSVIHKITDREGNVVYTHEPVYKDAVLKPETAKYILSCMQSGAENGIGWRANLGDVTIAVKTGTAQMADTVHGGYSDTDFLSDCLALFPAENPEIILYIVLQKSKGINFASRIVAPVIKDSADAIIDHLGMSRASATSLSHPSTVYIPNQAPVKIGSRLPNFRGMTKKDILPLIEKENVNIKLHGNGWVKEQSPAPGTDVTENMVIELYLE